MPKKARPRGARRWGKDFPNRKAINKTNAELPAPAPPSLPLAEVSPAPLTPASPPMYAELSLTHPKCTKCGTLFMSPHAKCTICGEWSPAKQLIHPSLRLDDDSTLRIKALKIWAMRQAGVSDEGIAQELGIAKSTVYSSIYRAGLNGWLEFDDPKNSLEYQLLPKVIRNLNEMLDSGDPDTRKEITKHVSDGALYPKMNAQAQSAAPALVGIKIQIVGGETGELRAGTVMGNSTYIDSEPVE